MKSLTVIFLTLAFFHASLVARGDRHADKPFTRADTLRGMLSPERTCYDVLFYDLSVKVYPDSQFIEGTVYMTFKALNDFNKMQIDLFDNMNIGSMTLDEAPVNFHREYNAVFLKTESDIQKDGVHVLKIEYYGKPISAKMPPWDGGFVWERDRDGNHWIGVACEEIGASLWWPNKDHLSDEPDSMKIRIIVPDTLMAVSNGIYMGASDAAPGWKQYDWRVTYPINNYNVTLYIGKYVHFNDVYEDNGYKLPLEYYVMPYNLEKAKSHFEQVKPMMTCFEKYFGRFPFQRDGFKLVEAPYLGMEHQSAIAYGNGYLTGYAGRDYSRIGLEFDYIIIHEAGHEWWGNAVSCSDIADLWIHEGFCTYSEALYVECLFGYDTALAYVNAKKPYIENKEPIIGIYNVNNRGAGDMYNKGMLLLNTLRHLVDNDELWFSIIRGIIDEFSHITTNTAEIENYISRKAGKDFNYFFDQYLRHPKIPTLEYSRKKNVLRYRWVADVNNFNMPVKATLSPGKYEWVHPSAEWQELTMNLKKKDQFRIAEELFYIKTSGK